MLAAPSVPIVSLTREIILRQAQALPAAPQVLGGLCELLQDANTNASDVAELIRKDPALAARVLRVSNSVFFRGTMTVSSIEEAVTRVGLTEMTRLVGTATVAGLFDRTLAVYQIAAERLRESLLMHALASEALARFTNIDPRAAYAGGLLRAVGMMVLDRVARGRFEPTEYFDSKRHLTYTDWELTRFGLTSVELTAILLDEWQFPPEIVSAMDQHVTPSDNRLANVWNLAGAIVAAQRLALPGDAPHWVLTPEKLATAGIDETTLHRACDDARREFERHRSALY
jgi:HD-like signal output (HDOD) protein